MNPHMQTPQNPQNFQHQPPQNPNLIRAPPKKKPKFEFHEKYVSEILNFISEKSAQKPNQIQILPDIEEEIRMREYEFFALLSKTSNNCSKIDPNSSEGITEEHVNRALAILSFNQNQKNDTVIQTTNNYSNSPSQTHQNRVYIANLAKEELDMQDQNK